MKYLYFYIAFLFFRLEESHTQNICDTAYVWNFLDENGKQTNDTKKITTHFESSLTQHSECYVLDRMDFSILFEQHKNEQEVLSLNDVSQYKPQLKLARARVVIFGKMVFDNLSDVYILTIKFQELETGRLLRSSPLNIERSIMRNISQLQFAIDTFTCNLIKGRKCADAPATAATNWEGIAGRLTWVSVASDGSAWGVNVNGEIYRWSGGAFNKTTNGRLVQISAGNVGAVWGINAAQQIFQWTGASWRPVHGLLKNIAVGADGSVWGGKCTR